MCTNEDSLKKEQASLIAALKKIGCPPELVNKGLSNSQKQNPTIQETTKDAVHLEDMRKKIAESERIGV
jgi:hypothetical protein